MTTRREHDSLGDVEVPAEALWGAQTQRAIENFPISGLAPDPLFIYAYVQLKRAAARVNEELGLLDARLARAIVGACDDVLSGDRGNQFVVDPFQAGAGTSLHMNVNEVLANLANERLGGARGTYRPVHPNDHVNLGQSTNDTFPTAMRLAVLLREADLDRELSALVEALREKGRAFAGIVTAGRTHLQDATPIGLGQVFAGYADSVERTRGDLAVAARAMEELGIGGTAVGTGVNRHPEFAARLTAEMSRLCGIPLRATSTPIAMHASMHDFSRYAGALKGVALELVRIANDLRLMSSGPTSGLGEIALPPVQPGSSIMPGKVNPVMAENLDMVCFHVIGAETAVAFAAQAGQFQLNVMMPVIAYEILFSIRILTNAIGVFRIRCVEGITADEARCREYAERTVSLATMLNPLVGYERAAEIVKRAVRERRSIVEVAAEAMGRPREEIAALLDPGRWIQPGLLRGEGGGQSGSPPDGMPT
jgi:aspartate ammonia-lyase